MKLSLISLSIIILTLCVFINSAVVVNKLDTITNSSLVYSGLMPISDSSADKLFFTFYSAKDAKTDADIPHFPLIVVVGSPGSSAQYHNLAGMGPLSLKPDMTTVSNPSSVTSFANVMFVDLLGNGFSFLANTSNFPTKSEDYAKQLTYALNALNKESNLGKSNVIVIVGEGTFLRSLPGFGDISGLTGLVHLSAWPELYAVSRYYGVAGIELKIFTNAERVAIESTLVTCYNNVVNKKYP